MHQKGYKVEFIDKEDVGFVETYVLKLTTQEDDEITAYIDTENNVMLKLSSYIMIGDTVAELEIYFSHHRFVNDILFPFTIETKINGNTEMKMMVEKITFDVDIPDSLFVMPAIFRFGSCKQGKIFCMPGCGISRENRTHSDRVDQEVRLYRNN